MDITHIIYQQIVSDCLYCLVSQPISLLLYFYTQWRKAVCKVLWLSSRTHVKYLPIITDSMPVEILSYNRFLNFYNSMKNASNNIVKYISNMSRYSISSTMGRNLNYVLYKCNVNLEDLNIMESKPFIMICTERWVNNISDNDFINASLIRDLINVRDGQYDLNIEENGNIINLFNRDECTFLLNYLCTV